MSSSFLTPDEFRAGDDERLYRIFGQYSDVTDKYTPVRAHLLTAEHYLNLANSIAQFPFIISSWQSNVGANGSTVYIDNGSTVLDSRAEVLQERRKKRLYNYVYNQANWNIIEKQVITLVAREGNAILMINSEGDLIVESIFRFDVYCDHENKINTYDYKIKGQVVESMRGLRHGVEIFHWKDTIFADRPVAPSRFDAVFSYILLENKAVKLNIHQFANAFFSNVVFAMDPDMEASMRSDEPEENGKPFWANVIAKITDSMSGLRNAFRGGIIPGLRNVFDLGKSNTDIQFLELLKLIPERLAWGWSMVEANFGSGANLSYNNANTFDNALYDRFGRPAEQQFDRSREWFLRIKGIPISYQFYIEYNEPQDSNKLLEVAAWREDYKLGAITTDEYREKIDMPPLPGPAALPEQKTESTDVEVKTNTELVTYSYEDYDKQKADGFFVVAGEPKTLTIKTLESADGQKFLQKWKKAVNSQLTALIKKIRAMSDQEWNRLYDKPNSTWNLPLPKIETYYAFNVLKSDLLTFAQIGEDRATSDTRLDHSMNYSDSKYSEETLKVIDEGSEMLLKGVGEYKGVDTMTNRELANIILANSGKNHLEIADIFEKRLESMSYVRALMIGTTAISNAIMMTEYLIYRDQGAKKKRIIHVADGQARTTHEAAGKIGWVPIDHIYDGGFVCAGQQVNCRCDQEFKF